jgi:hypothetical protein
MGSLRRVAYGLPRLTGQRREIAIGRDYEARMTTAPLSLAVLDPADYAAFKSELQTSFSEAVISEFGPLSNGPIPSDSELDRAMSGPNIEVLQILRGKDRVGGCVLTIDPSSNENSLDLFFVKSGQQGGGIGRNAWAAIEARHSQTRVWRTVTPYFEKRNIHFYLNRCGFKIVEFYNSHHSGPHEAGPDDFPDAENLFLFEKIMNSGAGAT